MRAYLLLRNNRKTGPHTFEELLAMEPGAQDLIWVEGHSQCWRHPSELVEFSHSAFGRQGVGERPLKGTEVLPGICFRLPVHEVSSQPWGPVPTLAMQGLDLYMSPPLRQREIVVTADEGDEGLSLFSVLPQTDRSVRVSSASPRDIPPGEVHILASSAPIRNRQANTPGKALRRSRKKHPHHLDLSDLLAAHGQTARRIPPDEFAEGGFHIEFD